MNKKILVTGSNGQLGSELKELSCNSNYEFIFTDVEDLDITNIEALRSFFKDRRFNYIINCAAYTAVDKAETDYETAHKVNSLAAKNLAIISKELNISLVHISTDFVFDGTKSTPYIENDPVNPLSVYGKTKLEGEKEIINITDHAVIIRTSWLYSYYGNNFVKTMLRLGKEKRQFNVIFDQIGTPTYAKDLAAVIMKVIERESITGTEIYHYSNEGVASWYDFAKAIMDNAKLNCVVKPIETENYPTPAKRPHYSVLNKSKIKEHFGIEIPHWQDSLRNCMKLLGYK
jgi:dTDP-4-dehydrorhamnose reductase